MAIYCYSRAAICWSELLRILGSDLTLHKLEVFCLVAKLESVSRAAEYFGLSQPVITAHIRSLEKKLGVKIVKRQGRGISVTADGQRVLIWANEIISKTTELKRELGASSSGHRGSVIISSSMSVGSYLLPGKVVEFRRSHPNAEIGVTTHTPKIAVKAIREGQADFGISILDQNQDISGFDVVPIASDNLVLLSSPKRRLQNWSLAREQLALLPFVAPERSSSRRGIEDSELLKAGIVRRNIVLEFGHAEAIMRAVRSDIGLAFLFRSSIEDELTMGNLRIVKVDGLHIKVPVYLIKRREKSLSPLQKEFYDYLHDAFKGPLSN